MIGCAAGTVVLMAMTWNVGAHTRTPPPRGFGVGGEPNAEDAARPGDRQQNGSLYIVRPECYSFGMVRQVDAIFSQGALRPLEPLGLAEGARVCLSVEEETGVSPARRPAKFHTPKLAHPEDARDFVMEVREMGDAGV